MMRYFIITIDTEGDNLWASHHGEPITTRNTNFLPRFQRLCNAYGFKPVYLTNYEMANDVEFAAEAKEWLKAGQCEIGLHVHGWNNPPFYPLAGDKFAHAYLYEYPDEVMREKLEVTKNLIKENFGVNPVSHRAGKWAMDERYFNILSEIGIKVDCSYSPGIDWSNTIGATKGGTDYSHVSHNPQTIDGILEVPITVRKLHWDGWQKPKRILKGLLGLSKPVWFRPAMASLDQMKRVFDLERWCSTNDYVMLMLHSSELMPGGSPYFPDEASIEREYDALKALFEYAKRKSYVGCTLNEYYNHYTSKQ